MSEDSARIIKLLCVRLDVNDLTAVHCIQAFDYQCGSGYLQELNNGLANVIRPLRTPAGKDPHRRNLVIKALRNMFDLYFWDRRHQPYDPYVAVGAHSFQGLRPFLVQPNLGNLVTVLDVARNVMGIMNGPEDGQRTCTGR